MMLPRLTVTFTPDERQALQHMAEEDFRPPKEQLRWLLRMEAQRRGLLRSAANDTQHLEDEVRVG